jgi:hypothetical protein
MSREPPRQLSTPNGQFLPSSTLRALHSSSHQLVITTRTMQLNIKFTLKFAPCITLREAIKYFLNPTTNTTANKSNTLFSVDLKGMSGALQMISYQTPKPEQMHGASMHYVAEPFLRIKY